jgi:transposase
VFAANISKAYRYIIIEGDLKDEKKPLDLSTVQQKSVAASTNSVLASLSEFRKILENAGMIVVPTDRRHTSSTHHGCGGTLDIKNPQIEIHCLQCGKVVDRDLNAAQNILSRGKEAAHEAAKVKQEKLQTAQEKKIARVANRLAARKKKNNEGQAIKSNA